MMNFAKMMSQAQQMQKKLQSAQEDLTNQLDKYKTMLDMVFNFLNQFLLFSLCL
mgnify:CR=1 FL=1